jgi:hypothetical protein
MFGAIASIFALLYFAVVRPLMLVWSLLKWLAGPNPDPTPRRRAVGRQLPERRLK